MLPARTTLLMLVLAAGGCTRRASAGSAAGEPAGGPADAASPSLADDLPDVAALMAGVPMRAIAARNARP